jgi:hypothetical protein
MHTHVKFDFASKPPVMLCAACGTVKTMPLPMPLHGMNKLVGDFTRAHARCSDRETN